MDQCLTCGRAIEGEVCPYCGEDNPEEQFHGQGSVPGETAVEVLTCDHQWQADFITSLLESEGIPSLQRPTASVSGLEFPPPATSGGISILVNEEDTGGALDLIESAGEELQADAGDETTGEEGEGRE